MIVSRRCPTCGSENLPHRNYCRQCGFSLEVRCPGCGFANRIGDRFCGGCGEPLGDSFGGTAAVWQPDLSGATKAGAHRWALPDGLVAPAGGLTPPEVVAAENRLATVVKADLSGFTAMSELLGDPEEVTVIMNQVFDPLVACVRRYEGYIDNYAGDMIIAFFGTPKACQDSTERAVRAALEMREEVFRLNERNISHGVELGISTGVATGYGLWSEIGIGGALKYTLSGELGDYAALIEKYAERGTVGMCLDTYARVRHIIPGEEQPERVHRPGEEGDYPMYYAGLPEARPDWLTAARAAAPVIGQSEARQRLRAAWERVRGGAAAVIQCRGEAGSGKTCLLQDLARQVLEAGAMVYAAAGQPLSGALGHDPQQQLRHAVLTSHGIDPTDQQARKAWMISHGLSPASELPFWIRAASGGQPCLVVLDGLDWLPNELLAVVEPLGDSPVLVALASRGPLPPGPLAARAQVVDIPPLTADAQAELLARQGGEAPPVELVEWVSNWSGGNPLFALEFARAALEARSDDGGSAPVRVPELPWRVQELMDLALDGLPEVEHAVLMAGCLAADPETLTFDPRVVGTLIDTPNWVAGLQRLVELAMLREAGDDRLRFRHRSLWRMAELRLVDSVRTRLMGRLDAVEELLSAAAPEA